MVHDYSAFGDVTSIDDHLQMIVNGILGVENEKSHLVVYFVLMCLASQHSNLQIKEWLLEEASGEMRRLTRKTAFSNAKSLLACSVPKKHS